MIFVKKKGNYLSRGPNIFFGIREELPKEVITYELKVKEICVGKSIGGGKTRLKKLE